MNSKALSILLTRVSSVLVIKHMENELISSYELRWR